MKANMKNLLLEQTKIMLQELNEIEDVKDRLELRIEVAEFLVSFSAVSDVEINEGKDAIKENKAKPIIVEEDDEEPVEDIVEEPVEAVSIEEVIDAGENLAPEVAAQAADELEAEPVVEEEQVEEVVEEQPVDNLSAEFREQANLQIEEYGVAKEYEQLNYIVEDAEDVVNAKILLAYWLQSCGEETMVYYLNYFMSNVVQDDNGDEVYVGEELQLTELNNNNVVGFCDYVQALFEEEE
jgi:hypothetical protein